MNQRNTLRGLVVKIKNSFSAETTGAVVVLFCVTVVAILQICQKNGRIATQTNAALSLVNEKHSASSIVVDEIVLSEEPGSSSFYSEANSWGARGSVAIRSCFIYNLCSRMALEVLFDPRSKITEIEKKRGIQLALIHYFMCGKLLLSINDTEDPDDVHKIKELCTSERLECGMRMDEAIVKTKAMVTPDVERAIIKSMVNVRKSASNAGLCVPSE